MGLDQSLIGAYLRKGVLEIPETAPKYITIEYVIACIENLTVQRNWKPKVGDWYMCRDLFEVLQIESLTGYYHDPNYGTPGVLK